MKEKAFNNWEHNAIHLTFPNGNSISTTWQYCTHSDNCHLDDEPDITKHFSTFRQSNTVEIMLLDCPEKLARKIHRKYSFGGDSVKGHLTITEWLDILDMLAK